jgi:hypothetical protein
MIGGGGGGGGVCTPRVPRTMYRCRTVSLGRFTRKQCSINEIEFRS